MTGEGESAEFGDVDVSNGAAANFGQDLGMEFGRAQQNLSNTLVVNVSFAELAILTTGKLNPWLGPSIRGMIVRPLRDRLCKLSEEQQAARRRDADSEHAARYCRGCHLNAECIYGRVLEPDREIISKAELDRLLTQARSQVLEADREVIANPVLHGAREGLRGLTIAPEYPSGEAAVAGARLRLRVLGLAPENKDLMRQALLMIHQYGQQVGLGPDRVKVKLQSESLQLQQWVLNAHDLPVESGSGVVPWVRIQLETPLLLRQSAKKADQTSKKSNRSYLKQIEAEESLSLLLQGSIRTVRRALEEYGSARQRLEFDPRPMLAAASEVVCEQFAWTPVKQQRFSARRDQRWELTGWQGYAIYNNVPIGLLPWLIWGGRLGVGDSRNCGGGLWHLVLA